MNGDAGAVGRETAPKPCLSSVLVDRVIGRARRPPALRQTPAALFGGLHPGDLPDLLLCPLHHPTQVRPASSRPHTPEVFSLFSLLLLSPGPGQTLASSFLSMPPDSSQTLASTLPPSSPNMVKIPRCQRKPNSDLSSHSPLLTFPPSYAQPSQAGLTTPHEHERPASILLLLELLLEYLVPSSLATRIYLILFWHELPIP